MSRLGQGGPGVFWRSKGEDQEGGSSHTPEDPTRGSADFLKVRGLRFAHFCVMSCSHVFVWLHCVTPSCSCSMLCVPFALQVLCF